MEEAEAGRAAPADPAAPVGLVARLKAGRDRYRLKPVVTAVFHLVLPVLAIALLLAQYPLLGQERFATTLRWVIPAGLGLVAISLLQERAPKGTQRRLVLDALFVAGTLAWLWGLLGGTLVIRNTYDGHPFTVDVTPLAVVAVVACALNFCHDVLEYLLRRRQTEAPGPAAPGRADAP